MTIIFCVKSILINNMWDPISIFYICYCLNINMPDSKLSIKKEEKLIETIYTESVELRKGV